MTPTEEPKVETVDVTRWNRKQRRNFKKQSKINIPGRNMPYVQRVHGSIFEYNKIREQELLNDEHNKATQTSTSNS